jgi:hypothetical protein
MVERFVWEQRPLDPPQGVLGRVRDALTLFSFSWRDEMRIREDWPALSDKARTKAIYRIVRYRLADHGNISFLNAEAQAGNLGYVAFEIMKRFAALSSPDPYRVEPLHGHFTHDCLDRLGAGKYAEASRAKLSEIQARQLQKVRREAQIVLMRYELEPARRAELEGIASS